jgi:hypothetical protein
MWRWNMENKKSPRANKAEMKLRDEIGNLSAAFGSMVTDLKDNQDKLLSYGRGFESTISERTAELAHEKATLEISVAERTVQLNAANDELRSQAVEPSKRNQEITLFSKMNDFLQTSTTEAEAYSVISETVTQLSTARATCWKPPRGRPLAPANLIFPPNECWAHRRGQVHLAIGHDGADAILRALGALFKKHVRGSDIACRYGGEEFILILSPSIMEGARQRAEKIREVGAPASECKSCQPGPGRHCTVVEGRHLPRPCVRGGGDCQGGRPRALPGQTRRAESSCHVRGKSRPIT